MTTVPDNLTPAKVARLFAERSLAQFSARDYAAAAASRETANTFALVAIADALEAK